MTDRGFLELQRLLLMAAIGNYDSGGWRWRVGGVCEVTTTFSPPLKRTGLTILIGDGRNNDNFYTFANGSSRQMVVAEQQRRRRGTEG
ncbi:hypothetical protein CASFOL_038118 [Castilleja foliolosa]|uniref:Uncharacterized protein n=1 Tax=Castilleja foliolosa TaxID=1961234 RepID=A0ABD3BKJ5_9LAMI